MGNENMTNACIM